MQREAAHHRSSYLVRAGVWSFIFLFTHLDSQGQAGRYVRDEPVFVEEIDYYHETISLNVLRMATSIDEFFADDRILDETNETQLRVTTAVRYEDGKSLTLKLSLKGRIRMPYLQERLQLFIDTDGRERDIKDGLEETAAVTDDDKSLFTGVRFVPRETRRSRVSVDGGLRWRSGPIPFVRLRGRRTLTFDDWAVRLTQQFFWFEDRGFGETTTVDFERWLDKDHFFRATPSATWSEVSRGVDLRQIVNIFHFLSDDTMVGFDLDIQGYTSPSARVDKYNASFRWRQQTYREWMFFEVAPGLSFPRSNNFKLTPILTLKLEILFGDFPEYRR